MANKGSGGGGGGAKSIRMGRAHVELSAKDAGLTSKLGQLKSSLLGLGTIAIGTTAIAATSAIAGIVGPLGVAISHFDEIKDISDRLGATTEEVSAMGYAASMSASNIQELEGAATILQKKLAAAAGGNEAIAKGFADIGLDASKLIGMKLPDQFAAIADVLADVENPAQRNATAMELFGKSGAKMVPLLKDGAEAYRRLLADADKAGAIVNSEDAEAAARAADAMDVAWASIKNSVRAFGAFFLPVVPVIEEVSGVISDIAKMAPRLAKDIGQWTSETLGLGKAAESVRGQFGWVMNIGKGLRSALSRGDVWSIINIFGATVDVIAQKFQVGFTKAMNSIGRTIRDEWTLAIADVEKMWVDLMAFIDNGIYDTMRVVFSEFQTTLREIFARLAGVAKRLGFDDVADAFDKAGMISDRQIEAAQRNANLRAAKEKADIDAKAAATIAQRERERLGILDVRLGKLKAAEDALQEMLDTEKWKAWAEETGRTVANALGAVTAAALSGRMVAAQAGFSLAAGAAGTFRGGAGAGLELSAGGLLDAIKTNTKNTADGVRNLELAQFE